MTDNERNVTDSEPRGQVASRVRAAGGQPNTMAATRILVAAVRFCSPPPPPLVLIGHAASLTPY